MFRFDGIEDFGGAVFHSARWDHSVPLDGKKIAVIGTSSPGTDHPALVDSVGGFRALQRSANGFCRPNPEFSDEERAEFEVTLRRMKSTFASSPSDVSANIVCCHRTQFD